jgi:hypothetical protein
MLGAERVLRHLAFIFENHLFMEPIMVTEVCANMEPKDTRPLLRNNSVKSSSRNLDLPPVIYEDDVIMWCITLNDVEEFCNHEGESLTDDEMELVFYILNDNWRWDMIGEGVQRLRNGDHSFVAGCG